MRLDVSTLVLVHGIISVILIVALGIQYHITRRYAGMRLWLWGCISLFAGFVCVPARLIPGFGEISVICNNLFFVVGWLLIAAGYVQFFGKRVPLRLMTAGTIVYMILIMYWTLVSDNLVVRVVLFSLSWAGIMLGTAVFLLKDGDERLRFMRRVTGGILLVEGSFFAVRAVLAPFLTRADRFFTTDPLQLAMFFVLVLATNLMVICIIIMVNQRLQVEAHEARDSFAEVARQRELLMRELQHRVKNNLNMISMFLSIEKGRRQSDELRDVLANAIGRIRVISSIYERLYLSSDLTHIDIAAWVSDIAQYVRSISRSGLSIQIEAESIHLDSTLAVPLGLILTELLINASKYAYAAGGSGEVRVACLREMGNIVLRVQDQGVGLDDGFDPEQASGLGMRLVTSLSRQIGGQFTIDGSMGTDAKLVLPLPAQRNPA